MYSRNTNYLTESIHNLGAVESLLIALYEADSMSARSALRDLVDDYSADMSYAEEVIDNIVEKQSYI